MLYTNIDTLTMARKGKANRKPQQIVVRVKGAERKVRRRNRQKAITALRGMKMVKDPTSSAFAQYAVALSNPFHPDAIGVRIPDSICYPTTTSHIRYKMSITASPGGTVSMVWLPCLHMSTIMVEGSSTGSPIVYSNNPYVGGSVSNSQLSSLTSHYRVVAAGARVIMTDTLTSAKGLYAFAPVPLGGYLPDEVLLDIPAADVTSAFRVMGLQKPSATITTLPAAVAMNAQDLMQGGDITLRYIPYSNSATNFKKVCPAQAWSTDCLVLTPPISFNGTTGTATGGSLGCSSLTNVDGMLGYYIYVDNLPSTSGEFAVEIIYHLEYVPLPVTTPLAASTPSPIGSTSRLESIYAKMHTAMEYYHTATGIIRGIGRGLSTAAYAYNAYQRGRSNRMRLM